MADDFDAVMHEFFDFSALDDYDTYISSDLPKYQSEPLPCSDADMQVGWAAGDSVTVCPADLEIPDRDESLEIDLACAFPVEPPSDQVPIRVDDIDGNDQQGVQGTASSQHHAIAPSDVTARFNRSTRVVSGSNSASSATPSKEGSVLSATWTPESAKRKGTQSRIPFEARQILEDEFASNPYPCSWEMDIVAHQANLDIKRVRNWYNNTRARKKIEGSHVSIGLDELPDGARSLKPKLSKDSLEALDKRADAAIHTPQPSLNKYLAQSYEEDAVEIHDLQSAMDLHGDSLGENATFDPSRRGSIITSVTSASSAGTAPTMYTISSNGSHSGISSFGRERRRGRRRMAWKEMSHGQQSINGINDAGQPQKDLPFFCTFCKRAFKTKYEWLRHEDSVHALRTTWICCDTKGTASLESCPFCGQDCPDDTHMAAHKYQHCKSQPESKRTFYRRDHFVQHLHHVHFPNVKHPSVRVGCQARLLGTEGGSYFGCKELTLKWRRFGAPMKRDDPMMHCGFCGKISKDWAERCVHVAEHLRTRLHRSSWWTDRKETHLENLYSTTAYESFRCRYCQKVFTDVQAINEHSHCRVWSCRFLQTFDDLATDAGPSLYAAFPSTKSHHCNLCGGEYRDPHVEHAEKAHRYRDCNQEFYTSEEACLQHLHNYHRSSPPHMLQGSSVIEQGFMRNKGASFEPVEFNESWQPCLMDLTSTPIGPFMVDVPTSAHQIAAEIPRQRPKPPRVLLPKFYRLSTLMPHISSRVFLTRSDKLVDLPRTKHNVVEELANPHVTSLAMSAGLVSMAAVRLLIKPETQLATGMTELKLEGTED